MINQIFCSNNHLILDATQCQECGWQRPLPGEIGKAVWDPVALGTGLGGPGRGVFAQPGVAGRTVAFPSRDGRIIALDLNSGDVSWQASLEPGLMTRAIVSDGNRLLASISDERQLGQAEEASLVSIDPESGALRTLWQSDGHQLSPPIFAEDKIILRTSTSELVALSRDGSAQPIWCESLQAWWALPPSQAGDLVLVSDGRPMHGEGYLIAFSTSTGQQVWKQPTDGLISRSMTADEQRVVYLNGQRQLEALDLKSGQSLWKQDYKRVYSPPLICAGKLFVVVRGAAPSGETGHYVLLGLDPSTGVTQQEIPLPANARARLLASDENSIFLGCDVGCIHAYRAADGESQWVYQLGSKEDPIRTELVITDGLLLAGTYSGKVAAVQIAEVQTEIEPPEDYLSRQEFKNAAAAYVLSGNFQPAAEIYAQNLNDISKAYAVYDHAGLYHQAMEYARSQGDQETARQYAQLIGDYIIQAELDEEMGNLLQAARNYYEGGDYKRAAALYEHDEVLEYRKALDCYIQLGRIKDILRLRLKTPLTLSQIEWLEQKGRLQEAGEEALRIAEYRKAVDLFNQSGDEEQELEALSQLVVTDAEDFAFLRIAELARKRGQFQSEAQTWERLHRPKHAAQAYSRAARQAEQVQPENKGAIAELFQRARRYFEDVGLLVEAQQCRLKEIFYLDLPQIIVTGRTEKAFREGEFNMLELQVHNMGFGVAHDVRVKAGSGRFEIDLGASSQIYTRIAPETGQPGVIYLRPLEGQVGETVPLVLEWSWADLNGQQYQENTVAHVHVKRADDSVTGGTPAEIHYHGPVYQADGGSMEFIGRDKVAGDRIEGDVVRGQKGDRVTVQRGDGVRLSGESLGQVDTTTQVVLCPNCNVPVGEEDPFCDDCGNRLKK
jgi:outer membrane protein assembly factor BamB